MTAAERQTHLESFDHVWSTIHERHFDASFGGLDWPAIRLEYRPRIATATNASEVRMIISKMIGRLELSHFGLIPADAIQAMNEAEAAENEADAAKNESASLGDAPPAKTDDSKPTIATSPDTPKKKRNLDGKGRPGFDLRVLDGRAIVTNVVPDGPADVAGVSLGWELISIDQRAIEPRIRTVAAAYAESSLRDHILRATVASRLHGDPGDEVDLTFVRENDLEERRVLELSPARGRYAKLGKIAEYVHVESKNVTPNVGYIGFNMFLGPALLQEFAAAVEQFRDEEAAGIIVDLRGNPGGIGFFANAMAGWFFEYGEHDVEDLQLGQMFNRDASRPLIFSINPRIDSYGGKLAVLIDSCSASTSEIMAGGLKDLGRARLFGTQTAGAALPSTIETLPNGDGFQFAIANYVSRGGDVLEGVGVAPNEMVELSRDGLLAGTDEVLRAAIQWIEQTETNRQ